VLLSFIEHSLRRYTQISVFHNLEKQIHAAFRDRLRAQFGVESDFALE
jgi:hypothetical protein